MTFIGAKGGGSTFKTRSDTLRSNDTFEGLLVLCSGPIVGPIDGLKSQKINGTPIEDASGTANFKDVVMLTADGDPAKFPQIATLRLGAGASPISVGLSVGNTNPSGTPGPWVVKTLANTNADSIDLRFIVDLLYRQDKKGIYEAVANLEIEMKPIGTTTWINPNIGVPSGVYNPNGTSISSRLGGEVTGFFPQSNFGGPGGAWSPESNNGYLAIRGKTTSAYVHELRIDVPNTGVYADKGWDIRVRLREIESLDADPNFEKRTIRWESVAAVYAKDVGNHEDWRGVAWTQIFGKASDQFNGAPEIEGVFKTKIVSVPPSNVFNPETQQYTSVTWDGSFSKAFTSDPAWIINDALSDGLFGLSNLAPGAHLNKWDALELSKYCGQLVSDGDGGTHPRFTMNLKVTDPQKADEFVQYLAGAVSGLAWDAGNGEWRIKQDKPEQPSDIFTLETIEGEFSYSHSNLDTRFNDVTMSYLNAEMDFREDRVRVFDQNHIDKYGRKPTTIVAIGCTNRQEALRRATLRLRSSINEYRMVNFTTNRRGRLLQPFDTILVADNDLGYQLPDPLTVSNPGDASVADNRTTGRILLMDPARTTLTLRDAVRLEIGVTYLVHFSIVNPNYTPGRTTQPTNDTWNMPTVVITRTVTNTSGQRGDVSTLYLDSALPADTPEYANFALEAAGLPTIPVTYRILDVKPQEDGERVVISAIQVDTGKYAAADAAVASPFSFAAPTAIVPPPLPPVGGDFLSLVEIPGEGYARVNLIANWLRPSSLFLSGFNLRYRVNNGPFIEAALGVQDTSFEMVDPVAGLYYFEVTAKDRRGAVSLPLTGELLVNAAAIAAIGALQDPNTIAILEKTSILIPKESERNYRSNLLRSRGVVLGLTAAVTDLDTARTNWEAHLNAIVPDWDDVSQPSPVDRVVHKNLDALFNDALNLLAKAISEEDARRAIWENVATTPNAPEDNATVGAPPGTPVGTRLSEILVDDVDLNANTLLAYEFNNQTLRDYVDSLVYVEGQPVNTVINTDQTQVIAGLNALAQKVDLVGATNGAGTAFILNLNSVQVGNLTMGNYFGNLEGDIAGATQQVAAVSTRLDSINATFAGTQASITQIQEVLVTPSGGASAKALFQLDADGKVVGYEATNNGQIGRIIFSFDSFEIRDPNGDLLFLAEDGIVKMPNVEVNNIKANSITLSAVAAGFSSVLNYTAPDLAISSFEQTMIETPFFWLGDNVAGNGLATISYLHDSLFTKDTAMRVRVFVDYGSGYVLLRNNVAGMRVANGNGYYSLPLSDFVSLSSTTQIRIKVTAQGVDIGGDGNATGFSARNVAINIIKLGR